MARAPIGWLSLPGDAPRAPAAAHVDSNAALCDELGEELAAVEHLEEGAAVAGELIRNGQPSSRCPLPTCVPPTTTRKGGGATALPATVTGPAAPPRASVPALMAAICSRQAAREGGREGGREAQERV